MTLAFVLAACSQDKGNYDYVDLKEPQIAGFEDMSVQTFSRLQIIPDLGKEDFPTGEYSFEWKVLNQNASQDHRSGSLLSFLHSHSGLDRTLLAEGG